MSLVQFCKKPVNAYNEDDFFSPFLSSMDRYFPAIDVSEEKDSYTIKADLPGIKKEDVHLAFENGVLTIEGERKDETEKNDKNYHRVERSYGRFVRSFNLGTGIDSNNIQANYKDGVLGILIPKKPETKPKSIEIKVD